MAFTPTDGGAWIAALAQADPTPGAPGSPVDQFKYLGAAVFMLGAAIWFIRKAGEHLRDIAGDSHKGTPPRPKVLDPATRALLLQRGVNPAHVDRMSPSEAGFALAMLTDREPPGGPAPGADVPAHPGMLLFCPACGAQLGAEPMPLPADVTCGACERRVTARVGGAGRVVIGLGPPR